MVVAPGTMPPAANAARVSAESGGERSRHSVTLPAKLAGARASFLPNQMTS